MSRLLSLATIVLLLLGSSGPVAECRHLKVAGERSHGLAFRRLLVGASPCAPALAHCRFESVHDGGALHRSAIKAVSDKA